MKGRSRSRYENQEASALNEIKFALLLGEKKEATKRGNWRLGREWVLERRLCLCVWEKEKRKKKGRRRRRKKKEGERKSGKGSSFSPLNTQRSARFPLLEVDVSFRESGEKQRVMHPTRPLMLSASRKKKRKKKRRKKKRKESIPSFRLDA